MTRTLPAALAIGMAQHTTLGVERPFVDMTINGVGVLVEDRLGGEEVIVVVQGGKKKDGS